MFVRKSCNELKTKLPFGLCNGQFMTLQALDEAPELYGVKPSGEERVVIVLKGIQYVVILRLRAQTPLHQ